jgi:hypothetical protein
MPNPQQVNFSPIRICFPTIKSGGMLGVGLPPNLRADSGSTALEGNQASYGWAGPVGWRARVRT